MAKLIGTANADSKTGTAGIDQLFGLEGNDFLNGLSGADFLVGGGGVEVMQGSAGNDILFAQSLFVLDRVRGWFSPPPSDASYFESILDGGDDNDILMGNAILRGGAGNDILVGGNVLGSNGGDGADTLINCAFSGGSGDDTYISTQAGFAGGDLDTGTDRFIVDGTFVGDLHLTANENDIVEFHNVAGINSVSDIQARMQTVGSFSTVRVNATMTVHFFFDISGGGGPSLRVNETDVQGIFNQVNARIAAATLPPSSGNDVLFGDEVANTINGLQGADRMEGMGGNDTYVVDNLSDKAIENAANGGIDVVRASVNFTLGQFVENLTLTGLGAINGTGNSLSNAIIGNDAANALTGNAGNDTLTGNAGNDTLTGNSGNDTLTGNAGNDTLTGGVGKDKLTGGTGLDVFDFNSLADSGVTATTRDLIADFTHAAGERIDLSGIDATPGGADNAFAFITTMAGAFTAVGQVRFRQSGGHTFVQMNTDTNFSTVESAIEIGKLVTLVASDFAL